MRHIFAILLFVTSTPLVAMEPRECAQTLDNARPDWEIVEAQQWLISAVTRDGENPYVTTGDFDSDEKMDVAFLIRGEESAKPMIAVCLTTKDPEVALIKDLYCRDGIVTVRRGSEYFNFDTDDLGRYSADGIHAYCYEKAGATYQYNKDGFQMIVDSD
jgi:hypothetical protein